MYKHIILSTFLLFLFTMTSRAQVSTYSFWNYWGTYTEIESGTILASGSGIDDNSYNAIDIGFAFIYNGTPYTQMSVNANGFIAMGADVVSSNNAISSGATNNVICANNHNLQGNANATLSYELIGDPGNRVLTIQWKDFRHLNISGEHYNFQIKLYETTNQINMVYGDFHTMSTQGAQVGLRGDANSDFKNRLTTNNWFATTAGISNTVTCYLAVSSFPMLGWTFSFSPTVTGNPGLPLNPQPANTTMNISLSGVALSWTFGSNTDTYDLWFGPRGNLVKVLDNLPAGANTYELPVLTASTTYQWQVVEHNATGTVSGPVWTFSTICGSYSIPFTESFDSYTPPAVGCGTSLNVNGDAVKWISKIGDSYSGANRLHIGYNPAGQNHNDWYITPGLQLTGLQTYEVKFYYKGGSPIYTENLEVKWGNSPTVAGMSSPSIFSDVSFYKPNYIEGIASFTPSETGTYYIGWHCFSPGDQLGIEVDEISVTLTPSCISPLSVSVESITSASANIRWTGAATDVRIQYGPAGFTPGSSEGITVSTGTNGYTLSQLLSSTSYDVYVQQDCGSGYFSAWTGPATFTTGTPVYRTLNLNLYLQGLSAGQSIMNQAKDETGPHFTSPIADQITVELHNAANYTNIIYTTSSVDLSTSGTASVNIPALYNGSYFVTIKHRNSVETTTASAISFSGSSITLSFGTPSGVFGGNLLQMSDMGYAIYGGDVNQDNIVDGG
ncbi:MAG: hypothetical protein ACOYMF_15455, partial [Bacteroidales bacterium]